MDHRYLRWHLNEYLYSIAHPSYSSVIFNRQVLESLGYSKQFLLQSDYNSMNIHFDEAFVFIILLCLNGDIAVNGKVYTVRGSPSDSYSRSNEWAVMGGSIGGLIPLLNLYFHVATAESRKTILDIIYKIYANLRPRDLKFLPLLLDKYSNPRVILTVFTFSIFFNFSRNVRRIFSLKRLKYLFSKILLR